LTVVLRKGTLEKSALLAKVQKLGASKGKKVGRGSGVKVIPRPSHGRRAQPDGHGSTGGGGNDRESFFWGGTSRKRPQERGGVSLGQDTGRLGREEGGALALSTKRGDYRDSPPKPRPQHQFAKSRGETRKKNRLHAVHFSHRHGTPRAKIKGHQR